jgi:hypothetical protein
VTGPDDAVAAPDPDVVVVVEDPEAVLHAAATTAKAASTAPAIVRLFQRCSCMLLLVLELGGPLPNLGSQYI